MRVVGLQNVVGCGPIVDVERGGYAVAVVAGTRGPMVVGGWLVIKVPKRYAYARVDYGGYPIHSSIVLSQPLK